MLIVINQSQPPSSFFPLCLGCNWAGGRVRLCQASQYSCIFTLCISWGEAFLMGWLPTDMLWHGQGQCEGCSTLAHSYVWTQGGGGLGAGSVIDRWGARLLFVYTDISTFRGQGCYCLGWRWQCIQTHCLSNCAWIHCLYKFYKIISALEHSSGVKVCCRRSENAGPPLTTPEHPIPQ